MLMVWLLITASDFPRQLVKPEEFANEVFTVLQHPSFFSFFNYCGIRQMLKIFNKIAVYVHVSLFAP